jgi:AraC-like DNA-binding protein
VQQVQALVAELVSERDVSLAQLAARLEMPQRRLREHLAVAGVRFNDLVNTHRCELAKRLLADPAIPIEVIVERVGFSEPSTFYRAFKRWVGEPPVAYRKRLQG